VLIQDGSIRLSHGPAENLARPAIDPLFRLAAAAYGPKAVGIVLTGQLNDGPAGLIAIKDCGRIAMVQQPSEATGPSMPQSALRRVTVDHCCKLADMAPLMTELASDPPSLEEPPPALNCTAKGWPSGLFGGRRVNPAPMLLLITKFLEMRTSCTLGEGPEHWLVPIRLDDLPHRQRQSWRHWRINVRYAAWLSWRF
jgi:CheB methylesterase